MSLPEYSNWVPLPAPVTSGSGVQSYTDPIGDVWVAANGVNSGAWRRAREVLHVKYWRSAAFTLTGGAWVSLNMDTLVFDDYSLYSTGTGLFTPPIPGMWQLFMSAGATPTASGQYVQPGIWGTNIASTICQTLVHSSLTTVLIVPAQATRRVTALPDTYYCRVASSSALPIYATSATTFFEAHYLGTG